MSIDQGNLIPTMSFNEYRNRLSTHFPLEGTTVLGSQSNNEEAVADANIPSLNEAEGISDDDGPSLYRREV